MITAHSREKALIEFAAETLAHAERVASDDDRVDATLHEFVGGALHCVSRERVLLPDLSGLLVLSFRVGLEGRAFDVVVRQDMPGGQHAAACVRRVVADMRFAPLQGAEPVLVSFPVAFAPGVSAYPLPRSVR